MSCRHFTATSTKHNPTTVKNARKSRTSERVFDQPVLNDLVMSRSKYGFVPDLRLAYRGVSVYFNILLLQLFSTTEHR